MGNSNTTFASLGAPMTEAAAAEPREAEPIAATTGEFETADAEPPRGSWLMPAAVLATAAGWTAFFVWATAPIMRDGASPAQWAAWIADWAVPLVLLAALWLLAMRRSRREALRFGQAARLLSGEATALERRLVTVNRELSLARDFIAGQGRDLDALGRQAVERLSLSAERLQGLIHDNGEEVQAIGRVSTTAVANMERLRNDLPVLANSVRDLTNRLGLAGQEAGGKVAELQGGIDRLGEASRASEGEVASLRAALDGTVAELSRQAGLLASIAEERMAALEDRSRSFTAELRASESSAGANWDTALAGFEERMRAVIQRITELDTHATDNARQRLAALDQDAERIDRRAAERIASFEEARKLREAEAAEIKASATIVLREQLEMLDGEIARRQREHVERVEHLADRGDAVTQRLAAARGEGAATLDQIALLEQRLAALPAQAGESAGAARGALTATIAEVDALAEALERRIAAARQEALERVDHTFATRMAAITQSLQSEAIDLTRVFAGDIADTDWDAYLSGDRGRFTRRAVRLLDAGEADRVAARHADDPAFRDTVERYLHDFETMLREVLETRAGHPLALALVSSDMGKLYVALAQATERLDG